MSERRGGFRGALRRFVRGWRLPALLIAALLSAMGYWLAPRLMHDVTSTDGRHQWQASEAPLQRSVVWQPAVPLEAQPENVQPGDSLIRPRLADDATTLYFTMRKAAGGADIYRAEKTAAGWQPATPLPALNTDANEIGPELVADGSRLFFYSDRPGGEGGFDIYVSDRTNDGWSPPRNLGPSVNTPADDIDPAISPDGSRLYLASNRTLQMQAR
ncbi:MAG: PD40 domain-containing protein [Planctomycetes bacterium]|nr:PD40 domain-containing protein [Planctomycetota bacterium]